MTTTSTLLTLYFLSFIIGICFGFIAHYLFHNHNNQSSQAQLFTLLDKLHDELEELNDNATGTRRYTPEPPPPPPHPSDYNQTKH